MEIAEFKNAFYIKLGSKGRWAEDSISKRIVRIGWSKVKVDDIINGNWDRIRNIIKQDYDERGKTKGSTQDYNALKRFCDATIEDVFITFYDGKMFWCNLVEGPVEQDEISKFRRTKNGWSCHPINNPDKSLHSNDISGEISKTQAFQGTLCRFSEREEKIITRILNENSNPHVTYIQDCKEKICIETVELLKELHWKDCEILTDLIFIQTGWRRVSMQGGTMEFTDMEYFDLINNEKYAVQIKSGAKKKDFEIYEEKLGNRGFRKLFFVVFNPDNSIADLKNDRSDIEILYGKKLAELIFDLGLLGWVLNKFF